MMHKMLRFAFIRETVQTFEKFVNVFCCVLWAPATFHCKQYDQAPGAVNAFAPKTKKCTWNLWWEYNHAIFFLVSFAAIIRRIPHQQWVFSCPATLSKWSLIPPILCWSSKWPFSPWRGRGRFLVREFCRWTDKSWPLDPFTTGCSPIQKHWPQILSDFFFLWILCMWHLYDCTQVSLRPLLFNIYLTGSVRRNKRFTALHWCNQQAHTYSCTRKGNVCNAGFQYESHSQVTQSVTQRLPSASIWPNWDCRRWR